MNNILNNMLECEKNLPLLNLAVWNIQASLVVDSKHLIFQNDKTNLQKIHH